MSRGWIGIIVLLMTLPSRATLAAAPASQPASETVEALIKQLSADAWRDRQMAQEQLVNQGPAVVERLERLVKETSDEEARTRAEAALRQIEINDRSSPTLITLHLRNTPLPQVISELAKQANTEITVWPPHLNQQNPPKITVEANREPFWLVVKQICEKTGLVPDRMGSRRPITLMQRGGDGWGRRPFLVHNGMLIAAERAYRSHNVDFAMPERVNSSFGVQFKVLVDPKLAVLQGPTQIKLEEALDDKGNSLILPGPNNWGTRSDAWGSRWIWDMSTSLKYQPDIGTRIASLKGSARFVVIDKVDIWEIANVLEAKDVERTAPIGKCIVHAVSKADGDQYQVEIIIQHTANPAGQNPLTDFSTLQQCLRMVDAEGRAYACSGGGGGGDANQHRYRFTFYATNEDGQKPGPAAKLIWEIPLELKEIIVPITFKDLPIP